MYPDGPAISRCGREIQSMQYRMRDGNRSWEGDFSRSFSCYNLFPLLDQFSRP